MRTFTCLERECACVQKSIMDNLNRQSIPLIIISSTYNASKSCDLEVSECRNRWLEWHDVIILCDLGIKFIDFLFVHVLACVDYDQYCEIFNIICPILYFSMLS